MYVFCFKLFYFFKFSRVSVPRDPILRQKWIEQISKHQEFVDATKTYPVCASHFDSDKVSQIGRRTTLIKGSLPTLFPEYVLPFQINWQYTIYKIDN